MIGLIVPSRLAARQDLGSDCKLVWAVIAARAEDGVCTEPLTRLRLRIGLADHTVRRCLEQLSEAGWLKAQARPGQSTAWIVAYGGPEGVSRSVQAAMENPALPARPRTSLPAEWLPDKPTLEWCRGRRPDLDLSQELARFIGWWTARPEEKRPDWNRAFKLWVERAASASAAPPTAATARLTPTAEALLKIARSG